MIELPQSWDAIICLITVVAMFAAFVRELYPPEVVAMWGASLLFILGVVTPEDLSLVLSNPAPWTIAAMFVLSAGLIRTGLLAQLSGLISRLGGNSPTRVLIVMAVTVLLGSAFMNNTPIVVVMIPVVVQIAQKMGQPASRFLIPVSYIAIMGGLCTLVGTSTNLLVDGAARAQGLEGFTLFEVTPLAVCIAAVGLCYLAIAAPRLLPERDSLAELTSQRRRMKFFTEVVVPEGSKLVGERLGNVVLFKREGMRVRDVLRKEESLRRDLPEVVLEAGDRIVLRTDMAELLGLKDSNAVDLVDRIGDRQTTTVEALISPDCKLVGRRLGPLHLRRRYGVYPLAVHRRNMNIGRQLEDVVVRVGDTLLLEGAPEDLRRLAADFDLINIAEPEERAYRRSRAPLMLSILIGVIVGAAFGIAPIHILALIGVALILITRVLDSDEAFAAIDARLLALIFSMLLMGQALQASGAVFLIAEALMPALNALPPVATLIVVYAMTSILTELVTNNAVAVVMTPLAIALGQLLGIDPRPLVVAVMVAASASFATPIGYQTNTLVYQPGGYRFSDFLRIGVPMNILYGIVTCLLVPLFWPL